MLKTKIKIVLPTLLLSFTLLVAAIFPIVANASSIAQSYKSAKPIRSGSLVSLNNKKSGQVEASTYLTNKNLIGVVIGGEDSALVLNSDESKVTVASSGQTSVLVSDINGKISSGDKVTTSPIAGVGMKATEGGKVVGIAVEEFTSKKATESFQVTNKSGETKTANVGLINVEIEVQYISGASSNSAVPESVQRLSDSIAGKPVSSAKIFLGGLIVLSSVVISAIIVYTGVRASFISLGRNPLAQKGISRVLLQTLITAFGFIVICSIITYIILRI